MVLRVSKVLIYLFEIVLEVAGLSVLFGTTALWMLHLIFAFILSFLCYYGRRVYSISRSTFAKI